jgi:hypothetical protein
MEIIDTNLENEVLTVTYHELNNFNEWDERTISIEDIELEKFIRRKSKSDESYTDVLNHCLNGDSYETFFDIDLLESYDYKEEVLLDFITQ